MSTTTPESQTAEPYVSETYRVLELEFQQLDRVGTPSTADSYLTREWTRQRRRVKNTFDAVTSDLTERLGAARARHEQQHGLEIEKRFGVYRNTDAKTLLTTLATKYGYAWADVARMLGVSVPAIRKWRFDGGASAENTTRLATLLAFSDCLAGAAKRIQPAAWMLRPLLPEYTVTPRDLYSRENAPALLDLALGATDVREALSRLQPDWETRYDAHGFQVERFQDGSYGITARER